MNGVEVWMLNPSFGDENSTLELDDPNGLLFVDEAFDMLCPKTGTTDPEELVALATPK